MENLEFIEKYMEVVKGKLVALEIKRSYFGLKVSNGRVFIKSAEPRSKRTKGRPKDYVMQLLTI